MRPLLRPHDHSTAADRCGHWPTSHALLSTAFVGPNTDTTACAGSDANGLQCPDSRPIANTAASRTVLAAACRTVLATANRATTVDASIRRVADVDHANSTNSTVWSIPGTLCTEANLDSAAQHCRSVSRTLYAWPNLNAAGQHSCTRHFVSRHDAKRQWSLRSGGWKLQLQRDFYPRRHAASHLAT
jgi:hypothetical protein